MSLLSLLTDRFSAALQAVNVNGQTADPVVQVAGRPEFGDYQVNGVMALAKSLKCNPRDLATRVLERVAGADVISKMEVAGPGFINVTLRDDFLAAQLLAASKDIRSGLARKAALTVVVDYSSVNLAKEMHVGHLRSTIIGDALARVHAFIGHQVIRQNHVGDWGTQFGMLVAYLVESRQDQALGDVDLSDLESFYRLAKARFDDPAFAEVARQYVVRLQAGDPEVLALWQHFVEVSMSHCDKVYEQLGVQLTRADVRGESAYNAVLESLVNELHQGGVSQSSQGAEVVLLDEFKGRDGEASSFMVRKKDGGYMYGTTDLAALRYRAQTLKADRCLYVVDSRQALHFQQLFLVAQRAGFVPPHLQLEHVAFGMVLGPDHKPFKTREGQSIKLSHMLNEAVVRAKALVLQKQPDMPPAQSDAVAHAVGIGAVKYADLSKNRTSDYVFDWDSMLSLEGNTAPYLQYACVRVNSIVRRAGAGADPGTPILLRHRNERALGLHLVRWSDVLEAVVRDSAPHLLCQYLYELAAGLSRFYEDCQIISASGEVDASRLKLATLAGDTLKCGLGLLGITIPETM